MEPRGQFHLSIKEPDALAEYLSEQGWLASGEVIMAVGPAGEGNMNCTLRVTTAQRSFILKQSRPWVEKYPHIPAPEHRLLKETAFYQAVADHPQIAGRMPKLLQVDRTNRIACFEDLGGSADFTSIYADPNEICEHLPQLCAWLADLHRISFPHEIKARLENRDMRILNHEHLFHFPLVVDNQFDLDAITAGLQKEADRLKRHTAYVHEVERLGGLYQQNGDCLLHGDYFPGSWLKHGKSFAVIDPEFGFFGRAEYDVGVMIGHLHLAGLEERSIESVWASYGEGDGFNHTLALQFAGMEIMRRLIGVAQLPLSADLDRKAELLHVSERLVLG
jgi:5-methylthioribose kinase